MTVSCINWDLPDAPHATSYLLQDGAAVAVAYHDTWAEAMDRANRLAVLLAAAEARS
jgi:hypothetical protein